MSPVSRANFGPLVAYLLPGATVLWGLSPFSRTLQSWFASAPADAPTIGGFLYLTAASLAAGMTVNAVRWAAIDRLHAATGLPMPRFDFSRLGRNVEAVRLLIEIHYAHYQFNVKLFVALLAAYACYRAWLGHVSLATTNVYAEVDMETKAKALANCEIEGEQTGKPWREDPGLMEFLRTL